MSKKERNLSSVKFEPLNTCTYYWGHPMVMGKERFKDFVEICKLILACTDTPLADGIGREGSSPTLDSDLVAFNGVYPHCRETFYFPRISDDIEFLHPDSSGNFYRYCETGDAAYDEVVGACLEAAVYAGVILEYHKENEHKDDNMLWLSVKSHINKEKSDAN